MGKLKPAFSRNYCKLIWNVAAKVIVKSSLGLTKPKHRKYNSEWVCQKCLAESPGCFPSGMKIYLLRKGYQMWISMTLDCWLLAKPQLQMVNYPLNKWQQFWAAEWPNLLISLAFTGVNNTEITAGLRKRLGEMHYFSACLICSSDYFLELCSKRDLIIYLFMP